MNCRGMEKLFRDLACQSISEPSVVEQALSHVSACRRCAARMVDERALRSGLKAFSADLRSIEASTSLESKLVAVFQAHAQTETPQGKEEQGTVWWHWWSVPLAGAVVVCLFVMVSLFRFPLFTPSQPGVPAFDEASTPLPQAGAKPNVPGKSAPTVETSKGSGQPLAARTSSKRNKRPLGQVVQRPQSRRQSEELQRAAVQKEPAETEFATEFIPFMDFEGLPNMKEGQLVRVQLPRSSLESFGLPMNRERAREPVNADVLLGEDGLVRAIRFVY